MPERVTHRRGADETLEVPSAPTATSAPDLPPSVPADDDLDAIKKAVDDAASVGGALWFSYLFVLFYLGVAAGAVTHADLFFENPVKLPFLNVELPLLVFFFLSPILFFIAHVYTLVHLVMLTEKTKRLHRALHDPKRNVASATRESLQWQLPSNIFIQFLAGPREIRGGLFGRSLLVIAWVTLVIAPVLLLLMMQIQFLPFHSSFITWTQRLALAGDLALLWWLWRKILSGRETDHRRRWASRAWTGVGFLSSACAFLFSWAIATFPGERLEDLLAKWDRPRLAASLHDGVFSSEVDPTTRRRWLPFSSTLVLTGINIYEGLGIDDPEKAKWRDYVFRARGRDLKGAIFDLASLPKVDFEGAELQGASLLRTQLQGALLDGAGLQGASLYEAQLQGASLTRAKLQGAALDEAQLQGASLYEAQVQGASLEKAQLQGASLTRALLQGASLEEAQLQGASLTRAQLQGAFLDEAQLQGASLWGATLQGASLARAQLQASLLTSAELQGASLEEAQLQGASLTRALLQGASLEEAQLQGASLTRAQLQGASLVGARLEATDLSDAFLWRSQCDTATVVAAVIVSDNPDRWRPFWSDSNGVVRPWNDTDYRDLLQTIRSLPSGDARDSVLRRIQRLDCEDKVLSSCNPSQPQEPDVWRMLLEGASVSKPTYEAALARELKTLVCSGGGDAIFMLLGILENGRLEATGPQAAALIEAIRGNDCLVSASLTDADKERLLKIKQDAIVRAGQEPVH
jgi:uncharacterized protein YjbI with pentapeptide repeats